MIWAGQVVEWGKRGTRVSKQIEVQACESVVHGREEWICFLSVRADVINHFGTYNST
jgi:hypothetical protein